MKRLSYRNKVYWVVYLFLFIFLFYPPGVKAGEHLIPYSSFIEEFFWTYGCTPTASAMVLSYWDTSNWDSSHRYKIIGVGSLIDYYYENQCSFYNVPNTIDELRSALGTDYNPSTCKGDGATDPWDIDDGIRYVTNTVNGYNFNSSTSCRAVWPEVSGDWCWDEIKSEIDSGRPFVWSTGTLNWFEGHSVAAWGYTDNKYVILYDTWTPGGRVDWYYKYYLNDPGNSIESTQVNIVVPLQQDNSDIVLDDPVGGEKLFVGTSYPIWWYMWGTRITTVNIFLSKDEGRSWSILASVNPSHPDMWGVYYWNVPDTPSPLARIHIGAFDINNNYIAGDGSFGNFRIIRDTTPPTGTIVINNGASITTSTSVTLALSCVDDPDQQGKPGPDGSGCASMRFSEDNITWTSWENFVSSKAWTLSGSDGLKTVYVQFRDKIGNISSSISDSITLDRTGPLVTIAINNGADYTTNPSVILNISCSECVQMRFQEADYSYTGAWTDWEPYKLTKAWTFAMHPANGRVGIYAQFKDAIGNNSFASDGIILDLEAPGGSMLINNNAQYTNTTSVSLALECYDHQSGCSEMRFSNDNITWTAWEPVATSKQWALTPGDGTKRVYVEFKDNVGFTYVASRSIIYETVPPSGSISINNGDASTNTTYASLTLSCSDVTSGCSEMRFSNDSNIWSSWESFATSKTWALSSGNGLKRVYVQYKDVAGNVATFSDTITLETLFILSMIDAPLTSGNSSIAVDSNGKVHISSPGGALRYATNVSGSWVITFVDKAAAYSSIALDPNNSAHISYYDSTSKILKYATNAGGTWVTTVVDSAGDVGQYSSIAVDSNNKVHIAYYDVSNTDLKYATNASGSWIISTIDSTGDVGKYCSIGVDSNSKVHISYYDNTNVDLKYITNSSGVWVASILESYNTTGNYSSLAIDSNNRVHISYRGNSYGDLKYITNTSGSWVATTVEATRGSYTSIAVDSSNAAYIVYYDSTNYKLKFATNKSGTWVSSAIENAGNLIYAPAIALDSNKKAHISYLDTTTSDNSVLNYATNASGSWVISTLESAANPYGYTSIAVDKNGKVHMSYIYSYQYFDPLDHLREIGYGLKYATNTSGLWVKSIIDSDGSFTPAPTSIAIDSNNRVHISYYKHVRYPVDHKLLYATNSSGSWAISTIESSTTDTVGHYSSIAVDNKDKVHIVYNSATNGPLKYANNVSGSWVISSITGTTGNQISLALDSSGKAHVAYGSGTALGYASNASGLWVAETVDSKGGAPSIAVDSEDHVHISHIYFSGSYGALKYANNVSGSWSLSTIDNTGSVYYAAIKTDSNNRAHIVYFDIIGKKLKYATNISGAWFLSTIDAGSTQYDPPSIAIDTNDTIHIGYMGGGLIYGHSPDTSLYEGDFDIDDDVDGIDLAIFASEFGRTDCSSSHPCQGDFNGDGKVDVSDLSVFAGNFGKIDYSQ